MTGNCPQRRFKTTRAATATITNATAMMRITATTPPIMAAVLLLLVESVVDIPVESVVNISHSATLRDGSEQSVNTGKRGLSLLNRMCNYDHLLTNGKTGTLSLKTATSCRKYQLALL